MRVTRLSARAAAMALCLAAMGLGGCSTIRDLRLINARQENDIQLLRRELEEYKNTYTQSKVATEQTITRLTDEVEQARRDKEQQAALHQRQTEEWARTRRELTRSYEDKIASLAVAENELRQTVANLEKEKTTLQGQIQETEANRISLVAQLETTQREIAQRDARLAAIDIQVRDLQQDIETQTARADELQRQLTEKEQAIAEYKNAADQARNLAEGLRGAVATSETQLQDKLRALANREQEFAEVSQLIDQKNAELAQLRKAVETKDATIAQCQTRQKELEADAASFSDKLEKIDRSYRQKIDAENVVRYRIEEIANILNSDQAATAKIRDLTDLLGRLGDYVRDSSEGKLPPDPGLEIFHRKAIETLQPFIDQGVLSVRADSRGVAIVIANDTIYESREPTTVRRSQAVVDMLSRIANLANQPPHYNVMIEGHTDSDPVKSLIYFDNLHLSMLRAVNVARKLTKEIEPRIPPTRVRAVACGEYFPISTAKEKNRRIEIVFTPLY